LIERAQPLEKAQILGMTTTPRRLDDGEDEDEEYYYDGDDTTFGSDLENVFDFSNYALKYSRCQLVQRFSERAVKRGEYSAMTKDNLVVLRLCPSSSCSSNTSGGCSSGYGEYVISLKDYLATMMDYEAYKQESYCDFCSYCSTGSYYNKRRDLGESGDKDDEEDQQNQNSEDDEEKEAEAENDAEQQDANAADDEDGEVDEAEADGAEDAVAEDADEDGDIQEENQMQAQNYYGDGDDYYTASNSNSSSYYNDDSGPSYDCDSYQSSCNNYADTCSNSYSDYSSYLSCVQVGDGNGESKYYLGPYCDGSAIIMGIFYDPYCAQYAGNSVSINQVSGMSFNKHEFDTYYSGTCISCSGDESGPYGQANSLMCNQMYADSAKCNSNMAAKYDSTGYVSTYQSSVCEYTNSILNDAFDSTGSISSATTNKSSSASSSGSSSSRKVTAPQLSLLLLGSMLCLGLSLYSCYLHHEITNLLLKQLSMRGKLLPKQGRRHYDSASESDADSTSTGSDSRYVMA
jgi:hypothetical protein